MEQLDALQDGRIEMALLPFSYAAEKIPETSLALLPGLVPQPADRSETEVDRALRQAAGDC